MIRIARVTLREIHLALTEPFQTATGAVDTRRVLLVQLLDSDGSTAWSECVAQSHPTYSPETVDTCWVSLSEWIIPIALGRTYASPSALHAALEHHSRGDHMARASVEMGAWAIDAANSG